MFLSIFSARFLWLCVQRAWGCARVLPTSEALVPAHPELQRRPLRAPPPSSHYPDSESYSASAVFPRVCLMCAVRYSDCSEGSNWTGPHRAPRCVDTVAYPEAWQQPLKRGSRETDQALCADLLPHSPPPGLERPRLSQLSSQPSPSSTGSILLASILQQDIDYLPRCEVHLFETSPGTDGDMWPGSVMRKMTRRCADGSRCWCWPQRLSAAAETIQVHVSRFHRALSPVKHNTQNQDHPSAEEAVDLSHMKESLSHC